MPLFEYKIISINQACHDLFQARHGCSALDYHNIHGYPQPGMPMPEEALNWYAQNRWRLVGVSDQLWYLERWIDSDDQGQ